MKWSGHQNGNGFQVIDVRFEEVTALPPFSEEYKGRPLFVSDVLSPDFGFWVGGNGIWEKSTGGGGESFYAGTFEQDEPPTTIQITAGKWGFWYKTDTAQMFQVKNHADHLFAVEMGNIDAPM